VANAGTLALNIVDDAPLAHGEVDDAINIPAQPSSVASGNVVTGVGGSDPNTSDGVADVSGADGFAASVVTGVIAGSGTPLPGNVGVATSGTYGDLTLAADGSYSYTPRYADAAV